MAAAAELSPPAPGQGSPTTQTSCTSHLDQHSNERGSQGCNVASRQWTEEGGKYQISQ